MAFEWTAITPNDLDARKLEVDTFELVKEYQEQMRELVLKYLGRNVILDEIDTSGGDGTIPLKSFVNAVENNIRHLVSTDVTLGMKPTVEWRGGMLDDRRLDYTDVNRWFETIQLLYGLILEMQKRYLTTGTYHTGHDLDLQILGVV